jgi:hypothetical protein
MKTYYRVKYELKGLKHTFVCSSRKETMTALKHVLKVTGYKNINIYPFEVRK